LLLSADEGLVCKTPRVTRPGAHTEAPKATAKLPGAVRCSACEGRFALVEPVERRERDAAIAEALAGLAASQHAAVTALRS
jgi:hypothetical protein